jgi:hypothetical protein
VINMLMSKYSMKLVVLFLELGVLFLLAGFGLYWLELKNYISLDYVDTTCFMIGAVCIAVGNVILLLR